MMGGMLISILGRLPMVFLISPAEVCPIPPIDPQPTGNKRFPYPVGDAHGNGGGQ